MKNAAGKRKRNDCNAENLFFHLPVANCLKTVKQEVFAYLNSEQP